MIKFLRNKFDELYDLVNHKLHPVVESFDTIHFTPNITTKSGAHIRDAADLKRTMMFVIFAMIPCLLFGIWNVGHQHYIAQDLYLEGGFWAKIGYGALKVLPIVVVSYVVGLTVEFIFGVIRGHSLHEGFLVTGMLIPLVMPPEVPLWQVAIATVFAVIIGKEVFGGTGMNVINVALTARAFIFFSHPNSMIGDKVWLGGVSHLKEADKLVDGVTGATPLGELASLGGDQAAFAGGLTEFKANYDIWDTIYGIELGSIGETSVIAILLGAAFLLWTGVGSWRIMLSYFVGGLSLAYIFNLVGPSIDSEYMQLDPFHLLFLGGFMFGMVFMVTDPVTASQTNTGKYIYGFLAGFLSILIRVLNPAYPEGVMLGILIANVFAPTIDHYVIQANIKKRQKRAKLAAVIK